MTRRFLPLALLLIWAPDALAFPPCPRQPVEIFPLNSVIEPGGINIAAWFKASYTLAGNAEIIGPMDPVRKAKCRDHDQFAVPGANPSSGAVQLNPRYAPNGGYGIVVLPELPFVGAEGLQVRYTLDFNIDNRLLASPGEWLDVAQLDFMNAAGTGAILKQPLSSIYRIRKIQINKDVAAIHVIESRAPDDATKPVPNDQLIAAIALSGDSSNTDIQLQWTQTTTLQVDTANPYDVDTVLDIITLEKKVQVLLPGQWANTLSMGLLDYNVLQTSNYSKDYRVQLGSMSLKATTEIDQDSP